MPSIIYCSEYPDGSCCCVQRVRRRGRARRSTQAGGNFTLDLSELRCTDSARFVSLSKTNFVSWANNYPEFDSWVDKNQNIHVNGHDFALDYNVISDLNLIKESALTRFIAMDQRTNKCTEVRVLMSSLFAAGETQTVRSVAKNSTGMKYADLVVGQDIALRVERSVNSWFFIGVEQDKIGFGQCSADISEGAESSCSVPVTVNAKFNNQTLSGVFSNTTVNNSTAWTIPVKNLGQSFNATSHRGRGPHAWHVWCSPPGYIGVDFEFTHFFNVGC